jgi:hypothetical protein
MDPSGIDALIKKELFLAHAIVLEHADACRSLARPRGGSVFIFLPRAACAVDQFLFFTARSLHGGNHVLLLPRGSCAVLDFNSSAAQSLRGSRPHRSAPCRP